MSEVYPPTGPESSYPQEATQTNTMALISVISGVLGLTLVPLIGSIVAVITGPMARNEIRASAGRQTGEGLATAGIVLGWIGIGLAVFGLCLGLLAMAIAIFAALFAVGDTTTWWLAPLFSTLF